MERGEGIATMADVYIDPLEAAKKRQLPKNTGVSYFPGVNVMSNDLTAGSIFKPGGIDQITGEATPTPTPTPIPRMFGRFPVPTVQFTPIQGQRLQPSRPAAVEIDELVKRYAY